MALTEVFVPAINATFKMVPRDQMAKRAVLKTARFGLTGAPVVLLPVDSSGDAKVSCPMDANNRYGICGEAMAAHADNILTFRQGKSAQSTFDEKSLIKQYLHVAGGDYGLTEDQVVNEIWKIGITGDSKAIIVDAMDFDVTDIPLTRYLIDNFYTIQMAWSVPNAFINGFVSGSQWINAARPNNRNGHFTPLGDVSADGWYRNWTWGGWAWCGPDFIASVEPECFVAFSPRQFDLATGLDSKGRHIFTQAALWKTLGGSSIPASTIAAFPAPGPPPDVIPPVPPSPGPGPVAAGVVSIDLATRTVTAPAGWTLRTPHAAAVESKAMADLRNLADSFYAKHGDGSIPPDEKI